MAEYAQCPRGNVQCSSDLLTREKLKIDALEPLALPYAQEIESCGQLLIQKAPLRLFGGSQRVHSLPHTGQTFGEDLAGKAARPPENHRRWRQFEVLAATQAVFDDSLRHFLPEFNVPASPAAPAPKCVAQPGSGLRAPGSGLRESEDAAGSR
jgi:hypothetical protein